jgi:hypothetical protein
MAWDETQEAKVSKETQVCESLCLQYVQFHMQFFVCRF